MEERGVFLVLVLGGAETLVAKLYQEALLQHDADVVVEVASSKFWTHAQPKGAVKCPAVPPERCRCADYSAGANGGWGHSPHPCGCPIAAGYAGVGKLIVTTTARPTILLELPWSQAVLALVWAPGCEVVPAVAAAADDGAGAAIDPPPPPPGEVATATAAATPAGAAKHPDAANWFSDDKAQGRAAFQRSLGAIPPARWTAALALWHRARGGAVPVGMGDTHGDADPARTAQYTFRASCVRDGPHAFKSTDCYAMLADAFLEATDAPCTANLDAPDCEVVAIIMWDHVVVGISLLQSCDKQFRSGKIAGETIQRGASEGDALALPPGDVVLRPSTAMVLLEMATRALPDGAPCDPRSPLVILDPCSGTGTIASAVTAAVARGSFVGYGIGGEKESVLVAAPGGESDFLRSDARRVPLRAGLIDAVVTDLPFGLRCMNRKGLEKLYTKLVKEVERVLADRGVLIALTAQLGSRLLPDALAKGPWEQVPQLPSPIPVNVGGLECHIFVARLNRDGLRDRHPPAPPSKRQRRQAAVDETAAAAMRS